MATTPKNFSWALYAGLAYEVTPSLTLDLAYRFTDIGDAHSGKVVTYDNFVAYNAFASHDIMLGVRWKLGHQPAPIPVAFK